MSSTPYVDRMNAIARLRTQLLAIQFQIADEIAKAWRLAPAPTLETFALTLGMEPEEVRLVLEAKGIVVRTRVVE